MNPSPPANILIVDSGVGGYAIYRDIAAVLPGAQLHLVADNAGFPYGLKTPAELITRVLQVLEMAHHTITPDIIVIACNSASTVALPAIRERYTQPVVGVVPAIKPAAALTQSGVIGLLATPGTAHNPYTDSLIQEHASVHEVIRIGSRELVDMAERKMQGQPIDQAQLQVIIAPFLARQDMDTLVLACTHFPLLTEEIKQLLPSHVQLVDSGDAIARRVKHWVEHHALALSPQPLQGMFYFTTNSNEYNMLSNYLKVNNLIFSGLLS